MFLQQVTKILFLLVMMIGVAACESSEPQVVELPTRVQFPPTSTLTPTITLTPTPSLTPTITLTPTETLTPTPSLTLAPSFTPTPDFFDDTTATINRAEMMRVIADLQNFGNRHTNAIHDNGITGVDAARAYLVNAMRNRATACASPATVIEDEFTVRFAGETTRQANVVTHVPGMNPNRGVIVIGAHYDTIAGADPEDDEVHQPGADDNGSGVSAVLELLRMYCLLPRQQTVVFVLFAAEEPGEGRQGSRSFVRDFLPTMGWQIEAMLNLDTIGSATDARGAIRDDFALIYSAGPTYSLSRQFARTIQAMSAQQLPDFRINIEDSIDRQNRWGDHMSFTDAGIIAARLFEGSEDLVRQDTERDLINDIDPAYLEKNIMVTLAFLLGSSEGLPPPAEVTITGRTLSWMPVTGAQFYIVAQRPPSESNYVTLERVEGTSLTLPADTIFAIGTIGGNGLLGLLTEENYIQP